MEPVRFGVIGAGVIANLIVSKLKSDGPAKVVAVADVNSEAANKLAATAGGAKVYADYHQLLADPQVDAVYVATPPFLHKPMTIDALRAGKHVCCEKPFVLTRQEVLDIMAVNREFPQLKVNCCSSRYHNSGTVRRARELIATGALGEVYRVHFEQVTGCGVGAKLPAWRNDPAKNGGGISFDWGPYDLDWLAYLLGERFQPRVVFATMGNYFPLTAERVPPCLDVDGRLAAEIICDNGLTIHWERRAAEHGPSRHNVEIRGREAGLDLCFLPMGSKQQLHHYAFVGADDLKETILPDAAPGWDDTLMHSLLDLATSIRENGSTTGRMEDSVKIHGIFDAVLESARTQQAVRIPA
jgi:predicted dehydrogenase